MTDAAQRCREIRPAVPDEWVVELFRGALDGTRVFWHSSWTTVEWFLHIDALDKSPGRSLEPYLVGSRVKPSIVRHLQASNAKLSCYQLSAAAGHLTAHDRTAEMR